MIIDNYKEKLEFINEVSSKNHNNNLVDNYLDEEDL